MMDKIIVKTHENHVTVSIESTPHVSGAGDSLIEALGMMVFNWPEYFSVKI